MKPFKYLGLVSIFSIILLSIQLCEKPGEDYDGCNPDGIYGIVTDDGIPAADGYGWVINIGSENYKPINLADSLKIDKQFVNIIYENFSRDSYVCSYSSDFLDEIYIVLINPIDDFS